MSTATISSALGAGVAAGLAVAVPLGAIGVLLIETSVRRGFRVAWAGALGVATTDFVYATAAVAGGGALAATLDSARDPLRIASALVLLAVAALGFLSLRGAPVEADERAGAGHASTYARFVALTAVNPLTITLFVALTAGLPEVSSAGTGAKAAFALGVFAASASWQTVLAAGGTVVRAAGPRARLGTSVLGYTVVLGLAVKVLLG